MPIGIGRHKLTRGIEPSHLFRSQLPACSCQVLPQLLFVARAEYHARNGRPAKQPIQQFSATCGMVFPVSLAIASITSTTL